MNVGICTMEKFDNRQKDSVGSSRIRARWLIKYWPEAEEFVIGKDYDVMVFQKVYWQNMAEKFQGIKILDICDPDWLEGKPVLEYVDLCDATVTSTASLAEYMRKFRPRAKILCIPDRVDLEQHTARGPHIGDAKTIAWFGYHQNTHYLYKTFDFIIQKNLELVVICDMPFQPPSQWHSLKVRNIPYSYPGVHKELAKCDMVLMPGTGDDLRGKFKSNNKTLTAWALKLPVVTDPKDLDRFMKAEDRNKEAELRYQEILKHWDVKLSVNEYKDLITTIVREKSGLPHSTPTVGSK